MRIRLGPYHSARSSHLLSLITNDTIGPKREARRAKAHGEAPPPLAMWGVGLSRGLSIVPPTFGNPATSLLERSMGFAPPPRGGFAFLALPERHSACELSSYLGALQSIGHMAIYPEPGGPA
jgi:hypothetical protein